LKYSRIERNAVVDKKTSVVGEKNRIPFVSVQSSPGGGKTFLMNMLAKSVLNDQRALHEHGKRVFPLLITFNGETPWKEYENLIGGLCLRLLCR
jgi:predicted ATPase